MAPCGMQHKRQKLSVPSPPRDIPKAKPRLRVPSPPPVPVPSPGDRGQAKRKEAKGGSDGKAAAAGAGAGAEDADGFVNLYDADVRLPLSTYLSSAQHSTALLPDTQAHPCLTPVLDKPTC